MGIIRRNRFWFSHHDVYIEPTELEKRIAEELAERKRRGSNTAMIKMFAGMILSEQVMNRRRGGY